MKKKYRVTTRGKIVFPLVGLLLIYGLYMLIAQPAAQTNPENQPVEVTEVDDSNSTDAVVAETEEVETEVVETEMVETETSEAEIDEATNEIKKLEDAGFTIYYEPNAYYVPEDYLAQLVDFAEIALAHSDEQIIIEGNVNASAGAETEWDTEEVNHLGYTRALVVKNDLIQRGVDETRIVIYNNKDEKPLNLDLSVDSIALNRRVDVFFSQFMYKEIDTK